MKIGKRLGVRLELLERSADALFERGRCCKSVDVGNPKDPSWTTRLPRALFVVNCPATAQQWIRPRRSAINLEDMLHLYVDDLGK